MLLPLSLSLSLSLSAVQPPADRQGQAQEDAAKGKEEAVEGAMMDGEVRSSTDSKCSSNASLSTFRNWLSHAVAAAGMV